MLSSLYQRIRGLVALLWREVAKFGVVGGIGFFIDTGVFIWLMSGPMEGSNTKAKLVATAVATVFSWVANRYWTFRHRRQSNVARELVLFLVMNAIGAGIQGACVFIADYLLGVNSAFGLVIAGNVIGLFFGTVFRFFAYRFWVFSETVEADPAFSDDEVLIGSRSGDTPADNASTAQTSSSGGAGGTNGTNVARPESD
ncbi:polysaccharide synthesis protein GtrA [Auritidibacter sp. NML120779]|nr:polysaccharide synthesis protein GtrA [Auritidibacter sp. NML120779]